MRSLKHFVICGLLAISASALAQGNMLICHVQDTTGAMISKADVLVTIAGQTVAHDRTDLNGDLIFSGVDGVYDILIKVPGFDSFTAINTTLTATKPNSFALTAEGYSGPRVVAEQPVIETYSAPVPVTAPQNPLAPPPTDVSVASPVMQAAKVNWEYGAFFQGGVGLEDRTNFSFLSAGVQLGKILTPELGSGVLKGNIEYAVQVLPYWQSSTPKFPVLKCPAGATAAAQCYGPVTAGGTYRGASIEPIILRYNLTHGKRLMPWVQAAGGVVYTTRKYPAVGNTNYLDPTQTGPAADTSVWNFTPQGGVGAHYFLSPRRSVDFSANGVHISSASLGDKNPGVNVSLQMSVGVTWWK